MEKPIIDMNKLIVMIRDDVSGAVGYFSHENEYGDEDIIGGLDDEVEFYEDAEARIEDIVRLSDKAINEFSSLQRSLSFLSDEATELRLDF